MARQLLNLAELARAVGISAITARDWLSVLEAADQVVVLEPYVGNVGKRLIETPKLYLCDTGLLCFLLAIDSPAAMERSPFIGAIRETLVLGQVLRAREAVGSAARVCFWRDAHGGEVDFAIESNGRVRLIEAKWSENVDARTFAAGGKVRRILGSRAADEHWIACRTDRDHPVHGLAEVRALNAARLVSRASSRARSTAARVHELVRGAAVRAEPAERRSALSASRARAGVRPAPR